MENIIYATFTSVWDGTKVTTNCKVNMKTKEVFDIESVDVNESLQSLDSEYITINGKNYNVSNKNENDDVDFYYYN